MPHFIQIGSDIIDVERLASVHLIGPRDPDLAPNPWDEGARLRVSGDGSLILLSKTQWEALRGEIRSVFTFIDLGTPDPDPIAWDEFGERVNPSR